MWGFHVCYLKFCIILAFYVVYFVVYKEDTFENNTIRPWADSNNQQVDLKFIDFQFELFNFTDLKLKISVTTNG